MRMGIHSFFDGLQVLWSLGRVHLGGRVPLYCEWEVTDRCNMRCDFCGTRKTGPGGLPETSTQEALSLIDQLSGLGTKMVHFSGGEPTLRPDLAQLVRRAKEKKILVSLTTNGSASSGTMEQLLDADLIRVSIDGPEEFHDSMRKTRGAFKKAMETVEFLVSRGRKPLITSTYTTQTSYGMIQELVAVATRCKIQISLNMLGRNLNAQDPGPAGDRSDSYLSSKLFLGYASTMRALRQEYGNTIANPQPYLGILSQGGLDTYGCRAMDIAICIKSDGSVTLPCNGLSLKCVKGRLEDIYYAEDTKKLGSLQGKHPVCAGCGIRCMAAASSLLKLRGIIAIFDSYVRSTG
jgi:MoaA/NifB/PqqE/SkfB family radical SAM enzyme